MHDFVRNRLPTLFSNIFGYNHDINGPHATRKANLFYKAAKSQFVDKLILYAYPTLWNAWYPIIEVNVSRASFKHRLKSVLLNEYADRVNCNNILCRDCYPRT